MKRLTHFSKNRLFTKKMIFIQVVNSVLLILFMITFSWGKTLQKNYILKGKIESKRKDNLITIIFKNAPVGNKYKIVEKNRKIGNINILSSIFDNRIKKYRIMANYILFNDNFNSLIRTGNDIVLIKKKGKFKRDFSDPVYVEKIKYFKKIISFVDNREMVFVPAGKFVFGSNSGDRDEYPPQAVYLNNYYIDKYEVSNRDFKKFIDKTVSKPPSSWKNGKYDEDTEDLPVLVTYYEASAYAKWAGKRLPNEKEWEKAARGAGDIEKIIGNKYPWGEKFSPERVNSLEFWTNISTGAAIKKKYYIKNSKLLPVFALSSRGMSSYGAVNMSGNAMEWTSDWYLPYKNNFFKNRKYGKQYKVVRGGAFFSNSEKIRTTNREIGGIPNLYNDNIAGFRCIKGTTYLDIENKNR